jgi:hypothetical protein
VQIDGKPFSSGQRLHAGRYAVDLFRGQRKVLGGWVTIPATPAMACTLSDTPELKCR